MEVSVQTGMIHYMSNLNKHGEKQITHQCCLLTYNLLNVFHEIILRLNFLNFRKLMHSCFDDVAVF